MMKQILLAFLLLLGCSILAKAEYYTITNYDIHVDFHEDGTADFVETIEVIFSQQRHGIFRFIPLRDKVNGKRVDRIIENESVDGFKYKTYKEDNNFVFRIGDANKYVDGTQTYRIRYHIANPLNYFDDKHSEFYWDLLGISSPVEIENASFKLTFPENVNLLQEHVRSYSGASGATSSDEVRVQVQPRSIVGKTSRPLNPGEGLTVAVFFPENTFVAPGFWSMLLKRHSLLFAPLIFLITGIWAKMKARNKRQTIMTEYFPPEGISPAIAGGFVDHSVDNNDILCLIPHLANMGYLRLEVKEGGFLRKDDITFFKLKEAGPELFVFEASFFNSLFATGDEVRLKDLKDKFHTQLNSVKGSVRAWINEQGWYEADQKKLGCGTGVAGLIAVGWGAFAIAGQGNMDGIALIIVGLILFFLATQFNKRSPDGNETYRKLEGFRRFVKKAERPVIERLMKDDPTYYDKTMPFALAFGYLKQWNKQFKGLLTEPPSWYGAPGMHGAHLGQSWDNFSTSFPSEINSIGSVFNSSPSSSGSGGGGGGGFSGGGSGGGGTGSW